PRRVSPFNLFQLLAPGGRLSHQRDRIPAKSCVKTRQIVVCREQTASSFISVYFSNAKTAAGSPLCSQDISPALDMSAPEQQQPLPAPVAEPQHAAQQVAKDEQLQCQWSGCGERTSTPEQLYVCRSAFADARIRDRT